jgi:hypothetical protein
LISGETKLNGDRTSRLSDVYHRQMSTGWKNPAKLYRKLRKEVWVVFWIGV